MKNTRILLPCLMMTFFLSMGTLFAQEKITARGEPALTNGNMPKLMSVAPGFSATDAHLQDIPLSSFKGKRVILNIFPSLDTKVCQFSVRQFNARANELENTVVLCLSKDLPFAMERFCTVEGLENVIPLSVFRSPEFDRNYGLIIDSGIMKGLTARAVIVLDEKGRIIYRELVKNISQEPDYDAAIEALK